MSPLPDWYPDPDEAKPAPPPLLLVQAFANTLSLDEHTDLLAGPGGPGWLLNAGLLGHDARVEAGDLALARRVRGAIRSLLEMNADGAEPVDPGVLAPLRDLAGSRQVGLAIGADGSLGLESPTGNDLEDRLFGLLMIIRQAQDDGTWSRLKLCANDECGWAYYDRSRNQQGSWCDMAVCGNRLKNRHFRARRRR